LSLALSDPITYHWVCNMIGATCEAGTAHPSGATELILGVRAAPSFVFCVVFCRQLFVLLFFPFLAIVLSVLLRFTDSDYPFWYLQTLF